MNYVLFNHDGSIKRTNFTDVINQNNDGVNDIFVYVDGLEESGHSLTGFFVLPDGTNRVEIGEWTEDVEYIEGKYKNGWILTITENETFLPGIVYLTLQVEDTTNNKTLYTYRVALTINKTANVGEVTSITLAQYTQLKNYVDSNFIDRDELSHYVPYSGATNDLNLGNHNLASNSLSIYNYEGGEATFCGGFGTDSLGNLYLECYEGDNGLYINFDDGVYLGNSKGEDNANEVATHGWVNTNYLPFSAGSTKALTGTLYVNPTTPASSGQVEIPSVCSAGALSIRAGYDGTHYIHDSTYYLSLFAPGRLSFNTESYIRLHYGENQGVTFVQDKAGVVLGEVTLKINENIGSSDITVYWPTSSGNLARIEDLASYLPLSAGEDNPLTGNLKFTNGNYWARISQPTTSGNTKWLFNTAARYIELTSYYGTVRIGDNSGPSNYNGAIELASSPSGTKYYGKITEEDLTADRTYTLPNKSGTIALKSDIPEPGTKFYKHTVVLADYPTITTLKVETDGTISSSSYSPTVTGYKTLTIITTRSTTYAGNYLAHLPSDKGIIKMYANIGSSNYDNIVTVTNGTIMNTEAFLSSGNFAGTRTNYFSNVQMESDTIEEL